MALRALARIDVGALQRNCERLARELSAGTELGAVVKADGYGHGAVASARAAQVGGATWLCVAGAAEAAELRAGGIEGRILVMGALSAEELPVALEAKADLVAWRESFVEELLAAPGSAGARVHVKLDSGMGRLGTRDAAEADRVAERLASADSVELAGAMTHFATSDDDPDFLAEQLAVFAPWAEKLKQRHPEITVHAANSAATLRDPASHFDLVRCGIAIYGMDPFHYDPTEQRLEPVLELSSYVADIKPVEPGQSAGYGRRFVAERPTHLATLPIGYGDGVRRALTNNCDVLIDGKRYPLVGTVSMDNITVDVGAVPTVRAGETAVLIGRSGDERQTAEEVAERIGTINYEITCGVSARVPREYHAGGSSE
jgi:alanine racemase